MDPISIRSKQCGAAPNTATSPTTRPTTHRQQGRNLIVVLDRFNVHLYDLGEEIGDSFVRQYRDPEIKRSYFQTAKLKL
jgi:hypothetical protein